MKTPEEFAKQYRELGGVESIRDLQHWLQASILKSIQENPDMKYIDIARQYGVSPSYVSLLARTNGIQRRKLYTTKEAQ